MVENMVDFRYRLDGDGSGHMYEFPDLADPETVTVMSPFATKEEPVVGEYPGYARSDFEIAYYHHGGLLVTVKDAFISLNFGDSVTVWNIFDDPDHISLIFTTPSRFVEPDPRSTEPPEIDPNLIHGVLVQFTELPSAAEWSLYVIDDTGSQYLYDAGVVEPPVEP
jgi:hypothetical protein